MPVLPGIDQGQLVQTVDGDWDVLEVITVIRRMSAGKIEQGIQICGGVHGGFVWKGAVGASRRPFSAA
ncbi:hypothetical protein V5O39_10045 [Pseudomonas parakoreensis]